MEWKYTDSPVRKKFQAQWLVKKVMLTVFWNMKGPIHIDSLEKDATVNSAFYNQLLRQNSSYLLNVTVLYIYIYVYNIWAAVFH